MKWLFKRKRRAETLVAEEQVEEEIFKRSDLVEIEKEPFNQADPEQKAEYILRMQEQIQETERECEDIKFEYGQVTSHLKDIQLIDMALPEDKEVLTDIAQGIFELSQERERLQGKKYKMSDIQRRAMEAHEENAVEDVAKLLEQEAYFTQIKNDLRQLSAEKNSLKWEKKEIVARQRTLHTLTKCLAVILIALFVLMACVWKLFQVDITVPFLSMAGFAILIAGIIIWESRRNHYNMALTDKKCSRAVALSNKVKIKYVNTIQLIEYICAKYHVRNGKELQFLYEQYQMWKREWEKQQESTRLLGEYNQILLKELGKLGVKDRDLWFYQAQALIDPREMVEVRHELNVRRQKLRERLDYNYEVIDNCKSEWERLEGL